MKLSIQRPDANAQAAPKAPIRLSALLVLATLAAIVGVYRYHESQKGAIDREVRNQLLAIADMKVTQLSEWRKERISDGEAMMANSFANAIARRFIANPNAKDERARVLVRLEALCQLAPYAGAALVSPSGQIVLSQGEGPGTEEHTRQLVADVLANPRIVLHDFARDDAGKIRLGMVVPLRLAPAAQPFGAILLGIDPADNIKKLLDEWPIPTSSGELLLIRREGDRAVHLNGLRGRAGSEMSLSAPLAGRNTPAAQALSGVEGTIEGEDYRGVPVFAAVRRVPDSPWFLIAKLDADEVWRPITSSSTVAGVAAIGFILAAAAGVAFLWRRQQLRFYQERYRAEVERRALEGHYDYLTRYANDIILLAGSDRRILEANDRAVAAYGYSREELIGMDIRELRVPPDFGNFERQWAHTGEHGSMLFETVHRRRDGSVFPVEVSSRRVNVEGQVFRQSIIRDITERRAFDEKLHRAMQTLEESESRFRATFEQAAVGMAHLDLEGRFLRVNERLCAISGYTREEILRLNTRDIAPPEDFEREEPLIRQLVARELECVALERRLRKKDGTEVWIYVTISLLRSAAGEPLNLVSVVEDITERRVAESALLQSEERLRQVVENAPEGILVESNCVIRYLNPGAVKLFGAGSANQLLGTCLLDLVHPDDRPQSLERSNIVAQGSVLPAAERRFVRLDGTTFPVEVSGAPITFDHRPAGLMFFRNITTRKRNEAERNALEHQLRQAQKMESVGRLAGGVAHDFNNHLTVINGYCDMLLAQLHPQDPLREQVNEIRTAGERASALTRQLLAFSRKEMTETGPVSLNEVVNDAGRMLRRLIGEDVMIGTHLASEPLVILADRGQLTQVLVNLAVNARDAMPDGGELTIITAPASISDSELRHEPNARAGAFAVLSVVDTGCGMSEDTQQKIFEPFFTTKKVGTGLGLATVYGIVRQLKGWIRVRSDVGRGTRFDIFFPRVDGTAPERPKTSEAAAQTGTETVLIVEDQPEVRRLTMVILEKMGYRLLEARDGVEALALLEREAEAIDLMITDVVMPGMNGRELAARAMELRPGLKVLYISGYTADAIGRQGVLDPGVAYLPKPFTASQLSAKIREVLSEV